MEFFSKKFLWFYLSLESMFVTKVHTSAQHGRANMRSGQTGKTAKGYRLKPETHRMIRKIQNYVRGDLDEAINTACRKFLKEIKSNKKRGEVSMRTIIIFILLGLTVNINAQWTVQQFCPDYNAAHFINNVSSTTGYAAGQNGVIRKTTNKGLSWMNIYTGTTDELNAIRFGDFADTSEGYAVGSNGVILKTTNNGMNWVQQTSGIITAIFDVAIGRGDTAIACSIGGIILRTTNGGANWTSQTLGGGTTSVLGVYRYSFASFYACDGQGRIYISNNAGSTWVQYSTSTSSGLYSIWSASSTYLSCGVNGALTRSTNGGANWNSVASGTTAFLYDVLGVPPNGFLVAASDGSILRSTDLGLNFTVAAPPVNISLNEIEIVSAFGDIIALGEDGLIRRSTDYGATWNSTEGGTGGDITSINFVNSLTGYACASEGDLFRTTNGGVNWINSDIWDYDNTSIEFISSTGFITAQGPPNADNGNDCRIYKSTNSGLAWSYVSISNMRDLYSIEFTDVTTGWCLGSNAVMNDGAVTELFKTTNSGVNWINFFNFNINVSDIYFLNSATGWAAASGGNLARTTNGGVNWQQVSTPASSDYCSIMFVSLTHGYACGEGGTIITTTNSGQNWVQQTSGISDKLNSIHFGSASNGICVGENGTRLRTTNGGQTWVNNREEANIEILSCFMPTSINAYTGGSLTYIANFGGVVTGAEPISNIIPSEFKLEQNYPNPFNPKTNIGFRIAHFGFVQLKIFNMLGEEIATVVNEALKPRSYETEFDGSNLASGVYFYRLVVNTPRPPVGGHPSQEGNYSETKKMILLK